jgi:hypothetical protein
MTGRAMGGPFILAENNQQPKTMSVCYLHDVFLLLIFGAHFHSIPHFFTFIFNLLNNELD